ncbi:MAG: class IV adenylate cyclase [Candidatus Jordarchaeaceae archaeon]
MIEVEVKCRINSPEETVEKLVKRVNAKMVKTIFQKDFYLQHPSRDFKETDEAVRIRDSNEGVQLTYKGPRIDTLSKTREELCVHVDSFETTLKIFERIGFFPIARVVKSRIIFQIEGNITASIDKVQDLGDFIELECEVEDYDQVETKREELFSILEKLDLSRDNTERRSYLELIMSRA